MIEKPIFNKPRRLVALGLMILGLTSGLAGTAQSKAEQKTASSDNYYYAYPDGRTVHISKDNRVNTAGIYLTVANVRQTIAGLDRLIAKQPALEVNYKINNQKLNLRFDVTKQMDVGHVFEIKPSASGSDEAGDTHRDYMGYAGMYSRLSPAGSSPFGETVDSNAAMIGENVCENMADIEFDPNSQARLEKLFSKPTSLRAELVGDVQDQVLTAFCRTVAGAVATQTAGKLPDYYFGLLADATPISGRLRHQPNFWVSSDLPVLGKGDLSSFKPLERDRSL